MRSALFAAGLLLSPVVVAEELDSASQEALHKTQQLLNDPSQRDAFIKTDPKAQEADSQARKLAGSDANTQELYQLASQVMETLTLQAGGDPKKMAELLEKAQKDPAAFAAQLTPQQQAAIKALAEKLEREQRR